MSQESKYRPGDTSDEPDTYISIKRKVSKIDRFALCFAIDVERTVHARLSGIFNMFQDRSFKLICDFSRKCKLGSQRHQQDRILNQSKRSTKKHPRALTTRTDSCMSNDSLFYGEGAQLVHELLNQPLPFKTPPKHAKRKQAPGDLDEICPLRSDADLFEPSLYAQKIEGLLRDEIKRSEMIMCKLDTIQSTLRKLATNHRDQVDSIYSVVEERQASIVIRRSAYNLSLAATKATSTPITG